MSDRSTSLRRVSLVLLSLASSVLAGCVSTRPVTLPPPPPDYTPQLIVFVVVDQARADYLVRFRPLLRFGLARLLEESVVFTETTHDHAITTTAPGHATLVTGRHPAQHGVVNNWWFDRSLGEMVAAVGSEPSPELLLTPTLGDWLKATFPQSKVFSVSGKDRGAILTASKTADAAFWINAEDGHITSSSYYPHREPAWLAEYHETLFPDSYFGTAWEPLPEVVEQAAAYGLVPLDRGFLDDQFPHPIGSSSPQPGEYFYGRFANDTPFGDAYVLDFARTLILEEELGGDAFPDFLGLAFSALDKVGHDFGPDSPEVLDTLLRLDRLLGDLLDFLDAEIGLEHVVVSLSGDHGVTPLPEMLIAKGQPARRFGAEEIGCVQRVGAAMGERFGGSWFTESFFIDRDAVAAAGVDLAEVVGVGSRLLEECPGVERVWTHAELAAGANLSSELSGEEQAGDKLMQRLYANSYHPERSPDLVIQLEPHTLTSYRNATTHGTPYTYDRHVPWLLRLPEGVGLTVTDPVATVDVAPTLAALVGLTPPADLDGVDRGSHLR